MSAAEALQAARAAGVELGIDGDDLVLEASAAAAAGRARSAVAPQGRASWRCCGPARTAGRPRTGRLFFDERAGIVRVRWRTAAR